MASCTLSGYIFGYLGIVFALVFSGMGSAYGIAKSGVSAFQAAVKNPQTSLKLMIAALFSSLIALYGLIISLLMATKIASSNFDRFIGLCFLGSGLSVGLSGISAGFSIGIIGDAGVRALAEQPKVFTMLILILIFGEVLGLYGFILGLVLTQKKSLECEAII